MPEILKNRHEFMFYLACEDANPNGDPDMGHMPRVDPETMLGVITDAATKRRIRDYVQAFHGSEPGMGIFVSDGPCLNGKIEAITKSLGQADISVYTKKKKNRPPEETDQSRNVACEKYWDVRTFGAVMSTGQNAGQVRGPVQIAFARSLDPVQPMDIGITRVVDTDTDGKHTMGRKAYIPFGLYQVRGFVSANLAAQTGFTEDDFNILVEAMANMYDATRSASKGLMHLASPVIVFRHMGDPAKPVDEQARQALLGCAPAHKLFELADCRLKDGVAVPRSYRDYECVLDMTGKPERIDVGFMTAYSDGIVWNSLPDGEDWIVLK